MARVFRLAELVFVKLGGSLITDKNVEASARPEVIRRLAVEVRRALDQRVDLRLVLGHGSGSFGHRVAERFQVQKGCVDWRGYALTGAAATRLNRIVTDICLEADLPVVSMQASASARCRAGHVVEMSWHPLQEVLKHDLIPLVYGDVALDESWGTTIASTEAIFVYLARHLRPQRILLLGEVEGVYTGDPRKDRQAQLIPALQASHLEDAESGLSGSHAVDVTGGMRSKVHWMVDLLRDLPELRVQVLSGLVPGLLETALVDPLCRAGTWITA
jgi:isopentenyl phosphate kinase